MTLVVMAGFLFYFSDSLGIAYFWDWLCLQANIKLGVTILCITEKTEKGKRIDTF